MNKGYILHFDLQERGVNPLNPHMIFNELDNNTSDFFIVVTSGGKEVDIENADVTLAIIKPSGEAESQSIEIKDNCIYGNLKSYMKNEVGNYVASILLILDNQKVIIDEITYTITEDNVFRLLNDTVKEDERFPILTNMLNELYDIKIKEKQRELNEEQRIENENNRQNIFESKVNEVNNKINEVNKSKNEIVNTFNTLTAQQQQDAEVIVARDGEVSLKDRLDRDLNNLNKELDRVKKIEESKVSTIQTESNFTTVEATNNGYFEDIKLEGKTLVNLANISSRFVEKTSKYYIDHTLCETSKLDLNKPYTFIIYCNYLSNHNTNYNYFEFGAGNKIGDFSSTISINAKYNRIDMPTSGIYTMLLEFTDFKGCEYLACRPCRRSSAPVEGEIANYDVSVLLLEGDYTQNPQGYFEGLMSVGQNIEEVSVESRNSNLFNVEQHIPYGISNMTMLYSINYRSYYIKCEPNTSYFVRSNCTGNRFGVGSGFDIQNTSNSFALNSMYIGTGSATEYNDEYTIFRTGEHDKYLFVYVTNNGVFNKPIIHIEKSTEFVEYKDVKYDKKTLLYYNPTTEMMEKPILREWDTVEKHSDGKYYYHQKSGEIILNGSENWILSDDTLTNTIRFIAGSYLPGQAKVNAMFLCDTLSFDKAWYDKDVEGYTIINSSGHIYIRINRSKLSTQDVTGFKAWLQANPTTIVYQLAQEKIYECTNIDLITYENETNYIIESGAITPKSTIKVHNNISNIVRLLQNKFSLLENEFTNYVITQNRILLTSRFNSDTVGFSVGVSRFNIDIDKHDSDLYNLILNNILVGKDNYNRYYMEELISFYWMDFTISDEMFFTLSGIIEEQHNTEILEESPIE